MAKNVTQKVKFKATPEELYHLYMDPKKHAKAIGSKVSLQPKVGGRFSAFGMLEGRFLLLEKGKKIVRRLAAVLLASLEEIFGKVTLGS